MNLRKRLWAVFLSLYSYTLIAQPTFPINDIADVRSRTYLFTNATIVVGNGKTLSNASMLIQQDKIVQVWSEAANMPAKLKPNIPADALIINCQNKYIYPSLIDAYTDYGIVKPNYNELKEKVKQPTAWNPAMHSETNALEHFTINNDKAKTMRSLGFGAVLTHVPDGISRGTGAVVSLASGRENKVVLKGRASAHYSLNKGSSYYDYPNSLMGSIALLRQNFLDAQWYASNGDKEGFNLGLKTFNDNKSLIQIFEANDKWNILSAAKIGKEFNTQYIIKGGTTEYQRLQEIKATNSTLILPVNWPTAMNVEDVLDNKYLSLSDLKHWEMAPTNLSQVAKANIAFALTTADLKDKSTFYNQLRKAMQHGLSDSLALAALTTIPAQILQVQKELGSLEAGKLASFIITNGPLFNEKTSIHQNWILGERYDVKNDNWNDMRGTYQLRIENKNFNLEVGGTEFKNKYTLTQDKDTASFSWNLNNALTKINYKFKKDSTQIANLSGVQIKNNVWAGKGQMQNGQSVNWQLEKINDVFAADTSKPAKKDTDKVKSILSYPNGAYGISAISQQNILIKNATVWTNEAEGILQQSDVLVENGKIKKIGKNLSAPSGAKIIEGTGMHLSAGIIDEHSHIAMRGGVNECSQSVTAEVRVGDVLNPDDVNIYRQLSGGVTSSHLLHGSCNTIGGQTQLIKLRWGANAEQLKFANWDPQIKFALGENVKKSNGTLYNTRYPESRMGVYQVLMDAFTRAKDYQKQGSDKRVDLELEALSDILNKKLFITCHSYVQSEINGLIKVADSFGFTVNTFTHILEGYKVADKMKAHGANASTFSDWWAYKMEVQDAIPQNPYLMQEVGLNVAINSDDAEMARRLNQEAAKSIKYAGMKEEDALKMVTLNPAKMLHVADRVGSIKVGKDADLVLWSDNPLSIYAKCMYTLVDGVIYFDRAADAQMRKQVEEQRNALILKMIKAKANGEDVSPPKTPMQQEDFCEDDHHPR
jgi:imidazolonepropionase-like amidohydrolase